MFGFLSRLLPSSQSDQISADEFIAGLAAGTHRLVDVRERGEYAAGHLAGAVSMPLSRFDPSRLPAAADGRVVVMCLSGARSARAAAAASRAGRTDVVNFGGSLRDLVAAGGRIVTGSDSR